MGNKNNEIILGLGKYLQAFNLFCQFYGFKDIMKQPINLKFLPAIEEGLKLLGLKYVLSDFYYENADENCFGKDTNKIIYIGRDIDKCILGKEHDGCFEGEFYVDFKISTKHSYEEATRGNGRVLGYPKCCVENFMADDGYDHELFNMLSNKIRDYKNCNNYLNQFENIILHHIACSFECAPSIELAKNIFPYYIKTIGNNFNSEFIDRLFSEKTYILFKSLNWIKFEGGQYTFGQKMKFDDPLFDKIKTLIKKAKFEITIIDDKNIKIGNGIKDIAINNIQVFHFPKINDKEEMMMKIAKI